MSKIGARNGVDFAKSVTNFVVLHFVRCHRRDQIRCQKDRISQVQDELDGDTRAHERFSNLICVCLLACDIQMHPVSPGETEDTSCQCRLFLSASRHE